MLAAADIQNNITILKGFRAFALAPISMPEYSRFMSLPEAIAPPGDNGNFSRSESKKIDHHMGHLNACSCRENTRSARATADTYRADAFFFANNSWLVKPIRIDNDKESALLFGKMW